jgi:hypothetical protein
VEGREWAESNRFEERHFQGIENGNQYFQVLLMAGSDLLFLEKEGIVDFERFKWRS